MRSAQENVGHVSNVTTLIRHATSVTYKVEAIFGTAQCSPNHRQVVHRATHRQIAGVTAGEKEGAG